MAKSRDFTIGLVQHSCTKDRDENLKVAVSGLKDAAARGAEIICLQEVFSSHYFCTVQDSKLFDLAEPIDGKTVSTLAAVAKQTQTAVVVPFFERREAGVYHNSAAVIDADGSLLGVYRKMHIPDDPLYYEKFYFTPGDEPGFKVFHTRYAKIGVLICWDQWYPEAARITALKGAEVLFYPTAIGWHPAEKASEGPEQLAAWQCIQRSHAIANGVYVASVNRTGFEETPGTEGLQFFGSSFVADPFGKVLSQAAADRDQVLIVDCNSNQIEETRRAWPFYRDRRVDAYQAISARVIDE